MSTKKTNNSIINYNSLLSSKQLKKTFNKTIKISNLINKRVDQYQLFLDINRYNNKEKIEEEVSEFKKLEKIPKKENSENLNFKESKISDAFKFKFNEIDRLTKILSADADDELIINYTKDIILRSSVFPISQLIYSNDLIVSTSTNGHINIFYRFYLQYSYNLHMCEIKDVMKSKDGQFVCSVDVNGNVVIVYLEDLRVENNAQNFKCRNLLYKKFRVEESIEVIIWDENFLILVDKKANFSRYSVKVENDNASHENKNKILCAELISRISPLEEIKGATLGILSVSHSSTHALIGGNFCGLLVINLKDAESKGVFIACDNVVDVSSHTEKDCFFIGTTAEVFVLEFNFSAGNNLNQNFKIFNKNKKIVGGIKNLENNILKRNKYTTYSLTQNYDNMNNKKNSSGKNVQTTYGFMGSWSRRNIRNYAHEDSLFYCSKNYANISKRYEVNMPFAPERSGHTYVDNSNMTPVPDNLSSNALANSVPYVIRVLIIHNHLSLLMSDNTIRIEHNNCKCLITNYNTQEEKGEPIYSVFHCNYRNIVLSHPIKSLLVVVGESVDFFDLYGNLVFTTKNDKNYAINTKNIKLENYDLIEKKISPKKIMQSILKKAPISNLKNANSNLSFKITDINFSSDGNSFIYSDEAGDIYRYCIDDHYYNSINKSSDYASSNSVAEPKKFMPKNIDSYLHKKNIKYEFQKYEELKELEIKDGFVVLCQIYDFSLFKSGESDFISIYNNFSEDPINLTSNVEDKNLSMISISSIDSIDLDVEEDGDNIFYSKSMNQNEQPNDFWKYVNPSKFQGVVQKNAKNLVKKYKNVSIEIFEGFPLSIPFSTIAVLNESSLRIKELENKWRKFYEAFDQEIDNNINTTTPSNTKNNNYVASSSDEVLDYLSTSSNTLSLSSLKDISDITSSENSSNKIIKRKKRIKLNYTESADFDDTLITSDEIEEFSRSRSRMNKKNNQRRRRASAISEESSESEEIVGRKATRFQ